MKRHYRLLLTLLLLLIPISALSLYLWQNRDPFKADAITDAPFTALTYSIQAFLWWDEGYVGHQLDQIAYVLNFAYVKQSFPWRNLELARGDWDFTQADRIMAEMEGRGLRMIARLGQVPEWAALENTSFDEALGHDAPPASLEDWANYCGTIAERYQGRIAAYQIWNEPNLAREWGDLVPNAAQYVEVLAACSEAIRAVDSEAILISAGLAPTGNLDAIAIRDDIYLNAMYQAGFQQYVDVVGVHAPGYAPPSYSPDEAERDGRGRWATFRRVEDLRKIMLQHGDEARQMAILEFGWTTDTIHSDYAWFAVSEDEQAEYIIEAYAYAAEHWRPWVGLMSLIYMPQHDWTAEDEEWWWAIAKPDGGVRPAFYRIIEMSRYCGSIVISGWLKGMSEEEFREQRQPCY